MKNYCGRRVRIYKHGMFTELIDTGETGRLLEIDIRTEHVVIEDEDGNLVKLFYKLIKLI